MTGSFDPLWDILYKSHPFPAGSERVVFVYNAHVLLYFSMSFVNY